MSAVDEAYAFAKERILDGRFPGDEMISEGEVANAIGLSRTPVREAFLRLEADGLLRLFPKRGALVVAVSRLEVADVMETRMLVERYAIEKATERSEAVGSRLQEAIAEQERLVERGEVAPFVEADREFHRILVAATGNSILLDLHDSMRDRQTRMGMAAITREADRMESILHEHRQIALAIAAGDRPGAERLLRTHLEGTMRLLDTDGAPTSQ